MEICEESCFMNSKAMAWGEEMSQSLIFTSVEEASFKSPLPSPLAFDFALAGWLFLLLDSDEASLLPTSLDDLFRLMGGRSTLPSAFPPSPLPSPPEGAIAPAMEKRVRNVFFLNEGEGFFLWEVGGVAAFLWEGGGVDAPSAVERNGGVLGEILPPPPA
eukprot:CAMPEP_0174698890 /NCGR_PEP_ID=MMETSP1094-20130205/4347_1 /TAXON_ID=156173 /ORGANISM="Chrysochromulina brevifilum, Strain UTEX LB 985" /LENGTH=159 /DNA_ID=CAMNT_0015896131 /DNA_START=672 /DNA_END=1147 /DNA_ORIENTATION=+